jgi:hypothetical protein
VRDGAARQRLVGEHRLDDDLARFAMLEGTGNLLTTSQPADDVSDFLNPLF